MAHHFGPHVSSKKTLAATVALAGPGGLCQCFMGSPQSYAVKKFAADDLAAVAALAGSPMYVHAPYVVNLAGEDGVAEKSQACLAALLDTAGAARSAGVVVHTGAKGTLELAARRLNDLGALRAPVLFENCCHEGTKLFWCADDGRRLLEACDAYNVGLCLDTCHLHASGWVDMADPAAVARLFEADLPGPDRRVMFHLNDSLDPAGSRKDRHAVVSEGTIWGGGRSHDSLHLFRDLTRLHGRDVVFETPSGTDFEATLFGTED
jgi:deoxyribonuclease-4